MHLTFLTFKAFIHTRTFCLTRVRSPVDQALAPHLFRWFNPPPSSDVWFASDVNATWTYFSNMNQPSHITLGTRHSGSTWDNYLLQESGPQQVPYCGCFVIGVIKYFDSSALYFIWRRECCQFCFHFSGVLVLYISFSLEGLWDWKIFSKLHCLFRKKGTYAALGNRSMNCPSYERLIALWTEERYRTCINCTL